MDKRSDAARSGYREDITSHFKKNKKRSSKRNNVLGSWMNNVQNNQNNDTVPGMEYQQVLWQSNMQQNFPNNGQRLFATTSDPSVCGYTPMPMTYAMEPVSLPAMYRLYHPVPFSGIRTTHGRSRRHCGQSHPMNVGNVNPMANGYTSLQENGSESPVLMNYQNGDYTSLPPTANKNNGINGEELNSEHRRYSDPGLGSSEAPVHTQSEDSDSIGSGSSVTTIGHSNKLVLSLIEQMTELKKSNSQLFRELSETKSELETIKVKLIQCKHNSPSDYQPGMLSDFIREIREANKTCEEGLVAKVKSLVDEKVNQKTPELDKLNSQILKLTKEKEESDRRVAKLEEEVATLKLNANNEGREIAAFEEETLALRRELQEARALKNLAENHVAKCVNAVARSVTPVSFETPRITSTPVRTALTDTCSLIPVVSSSAPTSFTSILRSSRSAEVAHRFVPEKSNLYRNSTDCSPMSVETLPDTWTTDDTNNPNAEVSSMVFGTLACTNGNHDCTNESSDAATEETASLASMESSSRKEEKTVGDEVSDEGNSRFDGTLENIQERSIEREVKDEHDDVSKLDEDDIGKTIETNVENLNCTAVNEKSTEDNQREFRSQRGGSRKSRKKKNNAIGKKSANEDRRKTSQNDGSSDGNSNNKGITSDSSSRDCRRTVSVDEDRRLDDDQTSRAITEIPEVTVVGGGSFVPKDLCSTGILTSRVLTAPSRATYTTAYI